MDISAELIRLIEHTTGEAIDAVLGTDGPLLSFMVIEASDGTRGRQDYPQGTSDDDIVAAASIQGVERLVLLSTGHMQDEGGQVPIVISMAAERGDPAGFTLVQRFVAGQSPVFSQPDGQITLVQTNDNWFRYAPAQQSGDNVQDAIVVQEAFKRFALRLMARAFQDPDPRVSNIAVMTTDGEAESEASFFYTHADRGADMKLVFSYANNVFAPQQFLAMDAQGEFSALAEDLAQPILNAYQN